NTSPPPTLSKPSASADLPRMSRKPAMADGRLSPETLTRQPASVDRMTGLLATVFRAEGTLALAPPHHDSITIAITFTTGRHSESASITSAAVFGSNSKPDTAMPK